MRTEVAETNAVGRMLGLLGDEWNLLIIQQAVMGAVRYSEFSARLPISDAVLSNRLRVLTAEDLLIRGDGGYLLSPRSRSLWPMLVLIWEWERRWVPQHRDLLPVMSHERCGRRFAPVLRCAGCRHPVGPETVDLALGPSGDWQRCVPAASTRRRSDPLSAARQAGLFPETMTVLGNRWAAAILLAAFLGAERFSDFQYQLGVPPSLLTERLQTFCAIGVLAGGDRGAYRLTDKGRAFFGVLLSAVQWAQRWLSTPDGPAIVAHHHDCGADLIVELACDQCDGRLAGTQVQISAAAGSGNP